MAIQVLQNQQDLSLDIMNVITEWLKNEDWHVQKAAAEALQNQQDLSLGTVNAIAEWLENEDVNVQQAAIQVLQNQQDLSLDCVNQYMGSLYQILLERSFGEHLNWNIADTTSSILLDRKSVV